MALIAGLGALPCSARPEVTVHQWAVLSWQQDKEGSDRPWQSLEPDLPSFAHRSQMPTTTTAMARAQAVAYFHMPQQMLGAISLDVKTGAQAGAVTGHYPYAPQVEAGVVEWRGVQVGSAADGLPTESKRWQASRAVAAAAPLLVDRPGPVGSKPGDAGTTEGEVFLFYQALAAIPAPLLVENEGDHWKVSLRLPSDQRTTQPETVVASWLADRHGNQMAYRALGPIPDRTGETTAAVIFPADSYTADGQDRLGAELREALNATGLHDDESAAVVNSLFAHPEGTERALLFLLPSEWLDAALPFEVAGPSQVKVRTGIGVVYLR